MPTKSNVKIGDRDTDILAAVASCPLTVEQLLKVSETFSIPFPNEDKLKRRLRRLKNAGYVKSWAYSIRSNGRSPSYFKVTRKGYIEVHGPKAKLPTPRYFRPIAEGSHRHSKHIADVLVHIRCLAHRRGWTVQRITPENSTSIVANGKVVVRPDATFEVCTPERTIPFKLELDNGTENIRNPDVESIERKIRGYEPDAMQYALDDVNRYYVLFVTTRTSIRRNHIVDVATDIVSSPARRLFLTATLADVLASTDLVDERVFVDTTRRHRSMVHTLLPRRKSLTSSVTKPLSSATVEPLSVNHPTSASGHGSVTPSFSSHTTASGG